MVENKNGMAWKFKDIQRIDGVYYGVKGKNKTLINEEQIEYIFLKDIIKSKKKTRALAIGLGVGIPATFVLIVFMAWLAFVTGQVHYP